MFCPLADQLWSHSCCLQKKLNDLALSVLKALDLVECSGRNLIVSVTTAGSGVRYCRVFDECICLFPESFAGVFSPSDLVCRLWLDKRPWVQCLVLVFVLDYLSVVPKVDRSSVCSRRHSVCHTAGIAIQSEAVCITNRRTET